MLGLAISGVAMGAIGTLRLADGLVSDLKDQFKNMKRNRQLCDELLNIFGETETILSPLKDCSGDLPQDAHVYLQGVEKKYRDAGQQLKRLQERVVRASAKTGCFRSFRKAKEWAEELEALKKCYDSLYGEIRDLAFVKGITGEIRQIKDIGLVPQTDRFKASFVIPKDLENVVLECEDPETLEGMLFAKVLDTQVGGLAAVALGMSGVGKTWTLIGISQNKLVEEHFTGGTYWMSLGQNATDADVVKHVVNMVEDSGGLELSERIRRAGGVGEAVEKAARWFSGHRCLFVCDDLWSTGSTRDGYFRTLKRLADERSGSRIVCSTRERDIAKLAGQGRMVHFRERSAEKARQILCKYAEFSADEMSEWDESAKEGFEAVLDWCGGLPVTLSIAGRAVEYLATTVQPRTSAWITYKKQLEEVDDRYDELINSRTPSHRGLFSALIASLRAAGQRVCGAMVGNKLSAQEMYEGLCVLEKQQWAPTSMLAKLWGLGDERKAGRIAQEFGKLSLADVETRMIQGQAVVGLKLHDLAHDYCVMQAWENNRAKNWHAGVLKGYALVRREVGEEGGGASKVREWWSKNISNDEYIHKNLGRHLVRSESVEELEGLLLDFRWTERQLEVNGLLVLENDFQLFAERLSRASSSTDRENEVASALKLISDAVRLSWPLVWHDGLNWKRQDLAFQMHGRLRELGAKTNFVQMYLESIEKYVKKPWAKAEWGCLEAPGGPLINMLDLGRSVWRMAVAWRKEYAVVSLQDRSVRVLNMKTREIIQDFREYDDLLRAVVATSEDGELVVSGARNNTLRILDVRTGECIGEPLRGHDDVVMSVAISEDRERIVSGSADRSLRIWDVRTRKLVREPLRGHEGEVMSVAISKGGERVVSGSMDSTLRIWDMKTGNCVGEPLRGHKYWVMSVAISGDGETIVSGSADCTLRIWDMRTGNRIGDALEGHRGAVNSVVISANGEFIVSASDDETIRIWCMKTKKCIGKPLRGHSMGVKSVAISKGGERVISGSLDRTLRIWDLNAGKGTGQPLQQHHETVTSVVASKDGQRLVSGSQDRTIRIWDTETGRCIGDPLREHDGFVHAVAISEDGEWIVSGSADMTLLIWEVSSGNCIGEPFRGHWLGVLSVAISKDKKRVASGSMDCTVRIWDVETRKCIWEPPRGHSSLVYSVAISGDGRWTVSGSEDRTLRIWDMKTGKAAGEPLRGHRMGVRSVATSENGDYVVSSSLDFTCRVWDIRTQSCLRVFENVRSFHRSATEFLTLIGDKNIVNGTLAANAPGATFLTPIGNRVLLSDNVLSEGPVVGTLEGTVTAWTFVKGHKLLCAGLDNGRLILIRVAEE